MSEYLYHIATRLHGMIAALGLAILLHPILTLRKPRKHLSRGNRWSLWLAIVLISVQYAIGLWLYPSYRSDIKPTLIAESIELALLFESKEHLAFLCLCCVWGGGLAVLKEGGQRAGWALLVGGFALGVMVSAFGVLVAAHPA